MNQQLALTFEDHRRLAKQLQSVRNFMMSGEWKTLAEIRVATGAPEASVSARLRDCRNKLHMTVLCERVRPGSGLYRYRVVP